jgi:mono/diheme cytochrome c family protein
MTDRTYGSILVLFALLLSIPSLATAQEKQVKKVPLKRTSAASAAEMYKEYCAVCHGKDGKGGGPAADALKTPPPDLTTLAKRHDGKFPDAYVANVLRNGAKAPTVHGSAEMPVWGPLLKSLKPMDDAQVNMRISNLTDYLKSLQAK